MMLTGRCTALQTLIVRRGGRECRDLDPWYAAAEEASYVEWGSFICSVQGTVKEFMYEQAGAIYLLTSVH